MDGWINNYVSINNKIPIFLKQSDMYMCSLVCPSVRRKPCSSNKNRCLLWDVKFKARIKVFSMDQTHERNITNHRFNAYLCG